MANSKRPGLRSQPRKVASATDKKEHWWWYEELGRITICHAVYEVGRGFRTYSATIRSTSLDGYLQRLQRVREATDAD